MKRTQHVNTQKGKNKTKMKVFNTREAIRIIRRNGWVLVRTSGDHYHYKHPNHTKILTISNGLNRMVWQRCVKEYDLNLNA